MARLEASRELVTRYSMEVIDLEARVSVLRMLLNRSHRLLCKLGAADTLLDEIEEALK
jgi:hypothetical protein